MTFAKKLLFARYVTIIQKNCVQNLIFFHFLCFQFFVWVEQELTCGLRFYEPKVLINTAENTEEGLQYDITFEYPYTYIIFTLADSGFF